MKPASILKIRRRPQRPVLAVVMAACLLLGGASLALAQSDGTAGTADRFAGRPIGASRSSQGPAAAPAGAAGPSGTRVAGSLGIVVVLICGLAWTYRRLFAAQQQKGGGGVSLVSRAILTPRHQVLILQTGHRLLIVGDSGQGMNLLCDVSEPAEIAAILGEAAGASGFPAALEEAVDEFGPAPPEDGSETLEQAPATVAQAEVRSLIERVREMTRGQGKMPAGHSS